MFEEDVTNFFTHLDGEEGEFQTKMTGFCVVYAPYCIHFLETDDEEYLDHVLKTIHDSLGKKTHEQAWMIFQTEEVPRRYFHDWYCRAYTASAS